MKYAEWLKRGLVSQWEARKRCIMKRALRREGVFDFDIYDETPVLEAIIKELVYPGGGLDKT